MAEFGLKNNIFEFKQQVAGAAISTKFAHPYACIYMDELEAEFLKKVARTAVTCMVSIYR